MAWVSVNPEGEVDTLRIITEKETINVIIILDQ